MTLIYKVKSAARRLSPAQLLTLGFAAVILAGAFLLHLPLSLNKGASLTWLDALFVSTSAVCVTGLSTVPTGPTFSLFGRTVLAVLIQIGGLGVATMGLVFILLVGGRVSMKIRQLIASALNFSGYGGIVAIMKKFLLMTLGIELAGAFFSALLFAREYAWPAAIGYGLFHSISAFNNAGFDVLAQADSLQVYAQDPWMNLVTTALVILGAFGYYAMYDICRCRGRWQKFALNTKVAVFMTVLLLLLGTLLLKLTTDQTWLESWFQSVVARTAGFSTYPLSDFAPAGILVFCTLMFIGANPGSTGGGIKTTTVFALAFKAVNSTTNDNRDEIFHRKLPPIVFTQALTVFFFALSVTMTATVLILMLEPQMSLTAVLVEVTSAMATVGSSTGVTASFCLWSKLILMACMFIGRLGPVTIANLLVFRGRNKVRYTEENILIG